MNAQDLISSRYLIIRLVLLLTLGLGSANAYAGGPCEDLKGKKADKYTKLGKRAAKKFKADDFQGAITTILELRAICDEDPRLEFNLARAYQEAENCHSARYWFESVLNHPNASKLSQKQPDLARESLAELEGKCKDSTRLAIECSTEQVSLTLTPTAEPDGSAPKSTEPMKLSCPFSGRVNAGTYRLETSAPSYVPHIMQLAIAAEDKNKVVIPPLIRIEQGLARVTVPCAARNAQFVIENSQSLERKTHDCPAQIELAPGPYVIDFGAYSSEIHLEPNETLHLKADEVFVEPGFGQDGWGWLSVGLGLTLLGTSVGLHVLASDLVFDVMEAERDTSGTIIGLSQKQAQDIQGRAETINTVAVVGDILGGAALVTGIILLALPEDHERPIEVQPEISSEHFLLRFSKRF